MADSPTSRNSPDGESDSQKVKDSLDGEKDSQTIRDSLNGDSITELIEHLSISEIDHADDLNDLSSDQSSPTSKDGDSPTKDLENCDVIAECDVTQKELTEAEDKNAQKLQRQKSKDENLSSRESKKKKGPLAFLRRLSTKEKEPKVQYPPSGIMRIRVESLPQIFITKYLGCQPCKGIWGAENTIKPVQDMIQAAKQLPEGNDLSLVKIKVTDRGLQVSTHRENKGSEIEAGLIPVEYISYGVQDFKFTRVFSFIMVREMSYKAKKMECHAYVCPSTANARKLSLSVALAFKEYAKSLDGKQFRFQVDLDRPVIDETPPSQEKAHDDKAQGGEEEC